MILRRAVISVLILSLAACSNGDVPEDDSAGTALERAAFDRGLIPSEDSITLAGRFEQRGDLGTDRFCAVDSGGDYDIGVLAVYGPSSYCEARGTARQSGETVRISLNGRGPCEFEARFDGIELIFPGNMPERCAEYCTNRASFSGVGFFYVESGDEAARAIRGRDFERLCD